MAQTERELVPLAEAMTLVDEVAGAVVATSRSTRSRRGLPATSSSERPCSEKWMTRLPSGRTASINRGPLSNRAVTILRPTRKRPPDHGARDNWVYPLSSWWPGRNTWC